MILLKTNLQYRGDRHRQTHAHTHVPVRHPLSKHLNLAPIKYCCRLCQMKRPPPLLKLPHFYPLPLFLPVTSPNNQEQISFLLLPCLQAVLMPQSTSLRLFFHCHRFTLVKPCNRLLIVLFVNVPVCVASPQCHIRTASSSCPSKITV